MAFQTSSTDILIVGAGIAGAGIAASIGRERQTLIVEREDRPGYHSTGRSAAIFIQNYGNAAIRALSRASARRFGHADPEFFPTPLLSPRGVMFATGEAGLSHHAALLAEADGLGEISPADAVAMVPLLNRDWVAAAAYEPDASDIDVNALHQGYLRQAARAGSKLLTGTEILGGRRAGNLWKIQTSAGTIEARTVVNAAGAWADVVAARLGAAPVGLQPMRRSMAILPAPGGFDISRWPLVSETAEEFYFKPDAGRLLVSPSEEHPVEAHDAFADDMVLAEGLDRYSRAVTRPVERLLGSWAGLRTFAPDRTPVAGFDVSVEGFFWLAGQGGYGIQTSPGLSALAAALLLGKPVPTGLEQAARMLDPSRFRR